MEKQTNIFSQFGGENFTIDQSFNKYLLPILPEVEKTEEQYKDYFESLSVGNMLLEKQLRKIEERNTTLLHKWHRHNSLINGFSIDENKYRNESVRSSNEDNEEKSISAIDISLKNSRKSNKNDGKILTPMALDRKKRHRRPASQIERHYKCPTENCSK